MTDSAKIENKGNLSLKVAAVRNHGMELVLAGGSNSEVSIGDKFNVYHVEETPIMDPDTGEPLEQLVVNRGKGEVVSLQEKICIIRSTKKARLASSRYRGISSALSDLYPDRVYDDETVQERPFDNPEVGDVAIRS